MKTAAISKTNFTGELWNFVVDQEEISGGITRTYSYVKDIEVTIAPGYNRGSLSVFSYEMLEFNAHLRELRDRNGDALFPDSNGNPQNVVIGVAEPVINVFGQIESWRHELAVTF